jgi:hypothetical protein
MIRAREDCARFELIIYDYKGLGRIYAGLYKTREEALKSLVNNWGLEP